MQAVTTNTVIGQPGYGWRYFVDARKGRAVVISPGGDYFYNHGKGLTLVFKVAGSSSVFQQSCTAFSYSPFVSHGAQSLAAP